jgi:hypothetical protein
MSRFSMIVAALLFAACGTTSQSTPADQPKPTEHAEHEHGEHGGGEHENLPPDLAKFHDLLAPRWHAEKGAKRTSDTCAAVPDFKAGADAVAKAGPPAGASADAWTAGTQQLADVVAALGAECAKDGQPGFDAAFENVHKGFHVLLEASGGGEHGKK